MAGQAAATGDMLDEPDETYFTLASMPRRLSRTFPFVYTYAANWTVKDAFREFVQNTYVLPLSSPSLPSMPGSSRI